MCEFCPATPTALPCAVCGFKHAIAAAKSKLATADRTVHVTVHLPARPSLAEVVAAMDIA